jgi:predicted DNA-binding transcriptional regulator YafY
MELSLMSSPATRLLTLIMLLQRKPGQKAGDLAAGLGVSVRTLHRYVAELEEMGLPVYTERGPYGGFSLVAGYRMPPLVFTLDEAVALSLGAGLVGDLWGSLYAEGAAGALAKLENVLPQAQRDEIGWARSALVATGLRRSGFESTGALLETLRLAIHERRRVEMIYPHGDAPTDPRSVDPYALVYRAGRWYLLGFCHLRQAVRIFRFDRIRSLSLSEAHFIPPADLDARKLVEQSFAGQAGVSVRLRFSPGMAQVARDNRTNWEDLAELADGSVDVVFTAPDLAWAASMVLAYGPGVRVQTPAELRSMVAGWAQGIVAAYAHEGRPNEGPV